MIEVAITNDSTMLTDAEVANVIPALQAQVTLDFCPVWGIDATIKFYPKGTMPPATAWRLSAADDSDQVGAGGYHLTKLGVPYGYVFVKTDIQAGMAWSATMSHELLEMLADPYVMCVVDIASNGGFLRGGGTLLPQEVADAPESDAFGYARPGADGNSVRLSDFVTPSWFGSPVPPNGYPGCKGSFDFTGSCTAAFQILSGGYIGRKTYRGASQWGTVQGRMVEKAHILKDDGTIMADSEIPKFSRRDRRLKSLDTLARPPLSFAVPAGHEAVSAVFPPHLFSQSDEAP